jgi:hypothetical protein
LALDDDTRPGQHTSSHLANAFHLSGRAKDSTGPFWIDQHSIRQEGGQEKTSAVTSMDSIYRCARKVAVALDDLELDANDSNALLRCKEFIDSKDGTYKLPLEDTIMADMGGPLWRLARRSCPLAASLEHSALTTFFVPVNNCSTWLSPSLDPVPVIRFDDTFLLALQYVSSCWLGS